MLKGIINEVDDLEAHVAQHASRHLWRFEQRQQIIDLILQNYPIDELPIPGHFLGDFEPCNSIEPTLIEKDTLEMLGLVDEFSSMAGAVLTPDQSTVFENLQEANGIHPFSGAPGAGKTFLTQYLTYKSQIAGKKVLLLATTGSAAIHLSRVARTVHSAFKIPNDGRPLAPMFPTDPLFEAILCADIIVIDEMSMLTSYVLSLIMYRLGQIVGSPEQALESKLVLLVGDHAQLPAACSGHNGRRTADISSEEKDEICFQCHISNSIWWKYIRWHHFISSVRHEKDGPYLRFLNILRFRRPTQDEIDDVLSDCLTSEEEALASATLETTILCTHNKDVDRFNSAILMRLLSPSKIVQLPLLTNAPFESFSKNWILNENFYTLKEVAIGASVVVTKNLNLRVGASNGGRGVVEGFVEKNGQIDKIKVRMCSSQAMVRVSARSKSSNLYHDAIQYTKHAFALRLGYAMTGHKSHGATISEQVIIHVRDGFCPGLLYVMLSRVTGNIS